MDPNERLRLLRGAIHRRDAAALEQPAVREAALVCPQHGGQRVLVTGGSGSALADELAGRLAEREWPGDVVLAEQLLGRLLPLPHVQLDEVAMALDDQQGVSSTWSRVR